MIDLPIEDDAMPAEIDFSKGVRGLHQHSSGFKGLVAGCDRAS